MQIPEQLNERVSSVIRYARDGWRLLARYFDKNEPTGLRRTIRFLLATLAFVLFALILDAVYDQDALVEIDAAISSWLIELRSPSFTSLMLFITGLAGVEAMVLLLVLWAGLLSAPSTRRIAFLLIAAAVFQVIISLIIKVAIGRERPDQALSLAEETSFSFPSGHTLAATVIWGTAAYLIGSATATQWKRRAILISYIAGVLLVAYSRMYLGVHFFSDTLASIFLGAGLLGLYIVWSTGHPAFIPKALVKASVRWRLVVGFVITAGVVALFTDFFV